MCRRLAIKRWGRWLFPVRCKGSSQRRTNLGIHCYILARKPCCYRCRIVVDWGWYEDHRSHCTKGRRTRWRRHCRGRACLRRQKLLPRSTEASFHQTTSRLQSFSRMASSAKQRRNWERLRSHKPKQRPAQQAGFCLCTILVHDNILKFFFLSPKVNHG